MKRADFFGFPVDDLSTSELVDAIDARINSGAPTHVVNLNPHRFLLAHASERLRDIFRHADITICDGSGIALASRLLRGIRLHRNHGVDLMERLVARAAERGHGIVLAGGMVDSAEHLRVRLLDRYPKLTIDILRLPSMSISEASMCSEESVQRLRSISPAMIFVSLGAVKEEEWIEAHRHAIGGTAWMGVGAAFDFLSGKKHRAPSWLRRARLEWLFRLWSEPRRLFARYIFGIPRFIFVVLRLHFARRKQSLHDR